MAPTPEETVLYGGVPPKKIRTSGEEVVISGMSGIFPKSDSVEEFMNNLYNKEDMVTSGDSRWVFNHPEVPKELGKVTGVTKFDAQFFRVHHKQAATMEPMSRLLLEHAYSAIYDAGLNPYVLRGKKVGVFIGSAFSESEKTVIYDCFTKKNGFGISGCNKAMYANRISYWLDAKGPSYTLDVACASSMACIDHAYRSIQSGLCEAAIVGGCNLCMHPYVSLNFKRAGFLCTDGKTKCFDKKGDGHVRSDAISVLFLQKAKDAKRIYSEVYHTKASYSSSPEPLLPVRDPQELQEFFEDFYSEIDVSPKDVEYVEANGAALAVADSCELKAIGTVFAKETPIKVGCVKSNMGSSEPASGACGLTKVCLAYHNGKLPGNLHYNEPLDIPAVKEDKIQVLTDNTNFNSGFAALNSLSYGGVSVHVLLKGSYKEKCVGRYKSSIPHLVLASGRHEGCLDLLMDTLKKKPVDPEQIGLLHNIHQHDIAGHMIRGYSILDTNENNETVCLSENIEYYPGTKRPVWFVYSGMGSQWATMGAKLMCIPVFAAAIHKCHKVLEPKGINIVQIITDPDKTIYDNILHSFVGIAAVQIGLTDILTELGIVPDNIIGHSVGELGCAYADGCFTAEEMILSAYNRGLVSVQTPFIRGSMAAVGLGYKAILPLCPPEIEVACHNSAESSTISGPIDIMKKFVSQLTGRGIFAKEVPCSNIAYHSSYIADAGPSLLKYLSKVIITPKLRSEKWVSTSVPQANWNEPEAKYSSAEYHTNNLLNPVLFEETSKLIPSDALVIEIAPHGLLQAILKRSLSRCVHVPLTKRGLSDPVKFLLEAIGKLFQEGLNPKVDILYPKIKYPVSTGTPLLSQFVAWDHREDWPEAQYNSRNRHITKIREFVMSFHDDDYAFLRGHVRDGNYVFPEAGILQLIWETLAMAQDLYYRDMSVEFRDVHFRSEAIIKADQPLRLIIMIHKGNDKFEVTYEDSTIAKGSVRVLTHFRHHNIEQSDKTDMVTLSAEEVYTVMRLKGYSYKDEFQSIESSNSSRTKADIRWTENWITFLDAIFQFTAFARDYDGISTPSLIRKLTINVDKHKNEVKPISADGFTCDAEFHSVYKFTKCGGVEVDGLEFKDAPVIEQQQDNLLIRDFVPYFLTGQIEIKTALQTNMQLVFENITQNNIRVVDLLSKKSSRILELIKKTTLEIPSAELTIKSFGDEVGDIKMNDFEETDLLIIENLLGKEQKMKNINNFLNIGTFILALEQTAIENHPKYNFFNVITTFSVQNQVIFLLKKIDNSMGTNVTYLPIVEDRECSWINRMQEELTKSQKVVIVSEKQPYYNSMGMVQKLRKEYGNKIGLLIIEDYLAPSFYPTLSIYSEQLQKNLAFNVLKKGKWGGYFYTSRNNSCVSAGNVQLTTTSSNDIKSLTWVEQPVTSNSSMNVKVCYAGPSFRDAQISASNGSHNQIKYGMDFSGVNHSGEKVMGLVSEGAIANNVEADPELLWPVPEHWTLEDAATVPLPYTLAYYCLGIRCRLFNGMSVFIVGGSGALGQALITVCLAADCTVYTSVSDQKKKHLLLKLFPRLDEKNITHTGTSGTSFQDMIRINTKDKRCNIVINCLSGKIREAAMKCVGYDSNFLDLSDFDMKNNEDFGMKYLILSTHYKAVRLSNIFKPENAKDKKKLQAMLSEGIAKGYVRPLTRVVYSPVNVTKAFRLLSSYNHKGKVLLKMNNLDYLNQQLKVAFRMTYSSKGSYIVVCHENIIGLELADRLVKRGARNILIHIKPNFLEGYYYTKFLSWNKLNVTIKISSDNLQTEKGCGNLMEEAKKLGPIQGIFIVQDLTDAASLESENVAEKFNNMASIVSKLDLTSRSASNELEQFVVISYSGNNVTDELMVSVTNAICSARKEINLPALSFHIGLLNELDETNPEKTRSSLAANFNALETCLKLNYTNVKSYNPNKRTSDFLHTVSTFSGKAANENINLNKLPADEAIIGEMYEIIKEACQINYPVDKTMASDKISDIMSSHETTKANDGLGAFFTYIDKDELLAAEPMVAMATTFSNIKDEEELDQKATYLMLVPGFEGHHEVLSKTCERLKVQAMTFQYGPELINADIPEMAASMLKFMKNRVELKSKFYILGYSFGVNVALELAALFEKEGHIGVVYCLDSSPEALRAQLDAYLGHLTDAQLQNELVEHMYRLMNGQDSNELIQQLGKTDSWEEKIELCVNKLRGKVNYSHQYKSCIIQGAYRRIMLAREYEPDFKLESEIVLMRGVPHPKMKKQADDYGLSKYSMKPVHVFEIEADHRLAPHDSRVSNIVNRFLEPKLLEAYKKQNLCFSYLDDTSKALSR